MDALCRYNIREFSFATPEEFEVLLAYLREMRQTYELTPHTCTLKAEHLHLPLQAPRGRPSAAPTGGP